MVNRPVQSLVMLTVVPVLGSASRKNWMFDREDEVASRYKALIYFARDGIEVPDIMKSQRTDYHVECPGGKVDIFNRKVTILDGSIVGTFPGARNHLLRNIYPQHPSRPLLARIAAVPAKTAAQVKDIFVP